MKKLKVDVEMGGEFIRVGQIAYENPQDACFCYEAQYLGLPFAAAISISLPLRPVWDRSVLALFGF